MVICIFGFFRCCAPAFFLRALNTFARKRSYVYAMIMLSLCSGAATSARSAELPISKADIPSFHGQTDEEKTTYLKALHIKEENVQKFRSGPVDPDLGLTISKVLAVKDWLWILGGAQTEPFWISKGSLVAYHPKTGKRKLIVASGVIDIAASKSGVWVLRWSEAGQGKNRIYVSQASHGKLVDLPEMPVYEFVYTGSDEASSKLHSKFCNYSPRNYIYKNIKIFDNDLSPLVVFKDRIMSFVKAKNKWEDRKFIMDLKYKLNLSPCGEDYVSKIAMSRNGKYIYISKLTNLPKFSRTGLSAYDLGFVTSVQRLEVNTGQLKQVAILPEEGGEYQIAIPISKSSNNDNSDYKTYEIVTAKVDPNDKLWDLHQIKPDLTHPDCALVAMGVGKIQAGEIGLATRRGAILRVCNTTSQVLVRASAGDDRPQAPKHGFYDVESLANGEYIAVSDEGIGVFKDSEAIPEKISLSYLNKNGFRIGYRERKPLFLGSEVETLGSMEVNPYRNDKFIRGYHPVLIQNLRR